MAVNCHRIFRVNLYMETFELVIRYGHNANCEMTDSKIFHVSTFNYPKRRTRRYIRRCLGKYTE